MLHRMYGRLGTFDLAEREGHDARAWPSDSDDMLRQLRQEFHDPAEIARLRTWAAAHDLTVRPSDVSFLSELARAAFQGQVRPAKEVKVRVGYARKAPAPATEPRPRSLRPARPITPAPPAPPPPADAPSRTWIEFLLLDDATQDPIAGVDFRIRLTDGTVATHTTDGAGRIRIDGMDPGTCGIEEISAEDAPEITLVS